MNESKELKSRDADYTNYENIHREIGELFIVIDDLKQSVDFLLGDWLSPTGVYSEPKNVIETSPSEGMTPVPARRVSLAEVLAGTSERLVEAQCRIKDQKLRLMNILIKC